MKEIWKPIAGYEGIYEISNLGRVKTLPRTVNNGYVTRHLTEKIRLGSITKDGYRRVNILHKNVLVHRIVAETFLPNPDGLSDVNHKDENKQNNCVWNLEWCTRDYNNKYGTRGERISNANGRPVIQKNLDCKFIQKWKSANEAELYFGNNASSAVSKCCNGKLKTAYGYKWEWAS